VPALLTIEFADQHGDPLGDLVADVADPVDRLAGRVGEIPVEIALARDDWAFVAAAHGDHEVDPVTARESKD
jgi:hypothetical protein